MNDTLDFIRKALVVAMLSFILWLLLTAFSSLALHTLAGVWPF